MDKKLGGLKVKSNLKAGEADGSTAYCALYQTEGVLDSAREFDEFITVITVPCVDVVTAFVDATGRQNS